MNIFQFKYNNNATVIKESYFNKNLIRICNIDYAYICWGVDMLFRRSNTTVCELPSLKQKQVVPLQTLKMGQEQQWQTVCTRAPFNNQADK